MIGAQLQFTRLFAAMVERDGYRAAFDDASNFAAGHGATLINATCTPHPYVCSADPPITIVLN